MLRQIIFFEWITGLILVVSSDNFALYTLGISNLGLCIALEFTGFKEKI